MTGSGQYALNLWREFSGRELDMSIGALMPGDAPDHVQEQVARACTAQPMPLLPRRARKIWWEQYGLVAAARRASVDLVHIPYFSAPAALKRPFVVTIHDVIPLALPDYGGSGAFKSYLQLVGRAVRRARLVITDSHFSAHDIQQHLHVPGDRIRVIPLAASPDFHPILSEADQQRVNDLRERYRLRRPFVLYVGGYDKRKRVPQIVEAFALARAQLDQDYDLVIAGSPHSDNADLYPPVEPAIRRWGIAVNVRKIGFVPADELPDLYRAADAFIFASEYEGFGLDPLEAMATGLPVICSNRASLPEVVGEGGYLCDPEPRDLAAGLIKVLTDRTFSERLRERALDRAAQFSWTKTADQTLDVYAEALGTNRS